MSNLTEPTAPATNTVRAVTEAVFLATAITIVLLLLGKVTNTESSWLEVLAVWASFASTWLCTRQSRWNYIFGLAATALLSITFYKAGLFGSMALNLYLIPTVIYGWFFWGKDSHPRPITKTTLTGLLQYLTVTALTWLGAYLLLAKVGGGMATLDGWLLVGSVLAQWMLDRKKLENWLVWSAVNIVSVYVYWSSGLHLLALQFLFFLANAVYAFMEWRRELETANSLTNTPQVMDIAVEMEA